MKHLQSFSLFEAQFSSLTPDQEAFLNDFTRGTWSVNQQTGLVDVKGDFDCSYSRLKTPSGISFGHVSGNFYCYGNHLTTLAGAPQTVGGDFSCFGNQLTTLVGAPQTVDGDFSCSRNHLTTLAGSPQTVGGNFWCQQNQLTTLVGAPQTVGDDFFCDSFTLRRGEWNPLGWTEILATGDSKARSLIVTLPQIKPDFWLELYRTNRKNFYDLWLTYRQDPRIRKSELFQQVESSLPDRVESSLEDLEDLRDLGI
jgi:hypothetical protein